MTVAYQKSAVINCGGYEDLQEDYYLWIKLVAQGQKVANLPDILVYARVGNGMVGRRRGLNQAKAEWRLFKLEIQTSLRYSRLIFRPIHLCLTFRFSFITNLIIESCL